MEDLEQNGTPGKVGCLCLFTDQEAGHLDESFMETCTNKSLCLSGGKKGGKGKGGGGVAGRGRGVRGVDFGLGIGYNAESGSQVPAPRTAAVNSLKTGMMQQFKSSFVSGSSNTPSSSAPSFVRPALRGFVSGGTIGGDARPAQSAPSFVPASRPAQSALSFVPASQPAGNSNENGNQNPERYVTCIICHCRVISLWIHLFIFCVIVQYPVL